MKTQPKKLIRLIVLYISICLFASCKQPVQYIEVEKTVIEEREVIIDNIINTESIEYIEKEVFVMSEEEIIVKPVEPIKEYDNYVSTGSGYAFRVFGVVDGGFEELPDIKGLFKIGNTLFFIIPGETEKFYSQENGVITEIEPADFPEIPASEHITFDNSPFKVFKYVYKGQDTSRVMKYISETMQPVTAYLMIDGACMRNNDLLFSVSECFPNSTRYKGVYIWSLNGNILRLFESGRIW